MLYLLIIIVMHVVAIGSQYCLYCVYLCVVLRVLMCTCLTGKGLLD